MPHHITPHPAAAAASAAPSSPAALPQGTSPHPVPHLPPLPPLHPSSCLSPRIQGHSVTPLSPRSPLSPLAAGIGKVMCCAEGLQGLAYPAGATSIAVSPCRRRVAFGGADESVSVWDAETGGAVWKSEAALPGTAFHSVLFSPCGGWVAASEGPRAAIWHAASGERHHLLEGHGADILCVSFSPCARYLLSGAEDGDARVWDVAAGKCASVLSGHTDWVNAVESAAGIVVTTSDDTTLRVWDLSRGCCLRTLEGHGNWANDVAVSDDGAIAVSCSHEDEELRVWHIPSGECLAVLHGSVSRAVAVTLSADGEHDVSWSDAEEVDIFRWAPSASAGAPLRSGGEEGCVRWTFAATSEVGMMRAAFVSYEAPLAVGA